MHLVNDPAYSSLRHSAVLQSLAIDRIRRRVTRLTATQEYFVSEDLEHDCLDAGVLHHTVGRRLKVVPSSKIGVLMRY